MTKRNETTGSDRVELVEEELEQVTGGASGVPGMPTLGASGVPGISRVGASGVPGLSKYAFKIS